MSYVTHLESTADLSQLPARTLQTTHDGRPLLVRYDLTKLRRELPRDVLRERAPGMWRWSELLPLEDQRHRVTLGEGETPLLHCPRLGAKLGCHELYIKDESVLPTGSFKARGMAVAVSMAKELGVRRVAVPTQGNAGGALAAYAARAGMECYVFMPDDCPAINRYEILMYGAKGYLVDGLIHDCGAIVRAGVEKAQWFDMSTLREPYRLEGKKTMGLELAEQMGWRLPDAIFYPTGGGTGLIGMWKGFHELNTLGWLADSKMPRMYACQSTGCAPLPPAFDIGMEQGVPVEEPRTIASGIRVPKALGDFLMLRLLRKSGGAALEAEESRLTEWMHWATQLEGVALCPEAAACIGALQQARELGKVRADERIVIFNTGAAQKYMEVIARELPRVDRAKVDWASILA